MLKGGNWHVFQFWKHFNNAFFLDTVEASSFKLHDYYFAWGLHFHGRFGDLCFEVTDVSEISAWNCAFQILVLVLVYCSLCVVWLLHTLRRSCTVWIVQLWCVFKGENLHGFGQSNVWPCWKLTFECHCSLHFQWSWHYFMVTAVSNSFTENFMFWFN